MKRRTFPTTKEARRRGPGVPFRSLVSASAVLLALGLWMKPAPAQEHAPAPTGDHSPAAAAPAPSPDSAVSSPAEGSAHTAPGDAHVAEPAVQPGEAPDTIPSDAHAEGTPPAGDAHGAAAGHNEAAGGHGAEGGAHGEEAAGPKFDIHLPSWIAGPLKRFWFAGPATLSAAGALDEHGNPLSPDQTAALQGKSVAYTYHDHHSQARVKPEYEIHPTIGTIGKASDPRGVEATTVQVDGQSIVLLSPVADFAREHVFPELLVISLLTALTIAIVATLMTRNLQRIPGRAQAFVELIYEYFDGFVAGLIGTGHKRYVPLVGTLFLYILIMNLAGLIPGWASPTANINVTAGLAIVVIVYVQYEGLRVNGFKGYLLHFVGEPRWLGPLNFPLHIIGELAKALSLTIRLFGNIFGEDVVIVILLMLGLNFTNGIVPLQFPMYFLAIFTSGVQAMVFSILTCVYIALMTSHDDHAEHGEGHDSHGHGDAGHHHAPAAA